MKAKNIALILAAVLLIALTPFGPLSTVAKDVLTEAMASPPSSSRAGPLAAPAETAFTYQGQLTRAGDPVTDVCRMQFSLWDADEEGIQIGGTLGRSPVEVANGLFVIDDLDFGAAAFMGEARWLEVAVQCPEDPEFTTLDPRRAITPTPYALYALSSDHAFYADYALNADTLDGQHAAFYRDVSNVDAGNLDPDRYSAAADLANEGYLGDAVGDIAQNNGVVQTSLNADLLDGQHAAAFMGVGTDNWVNTSGDTMTGDLAMGGRLLKRSVPFLIPYLATFQDSLVSNTGSATQTIYDGMLEIDSGPTANSVANRQSHDWTGTGLGMNTVGSYFGAHVVWSSGCSIATQHVAHFLAGGQATSGGDGNIGYGYGFKQVGTALYGVSYNGTTETSLDLGIVLASGFSRDLMAVVRSSSSIEFYVDGISRGTLSATIPSYFHTFYRVRLTNGATTTRSCVDVSSLVFAKQY